MAPALHPSAIQGKEGIKFCHLATLPSIIENEWRQRGGHDESLPRPPQHDANLSQSSSSSLTTLCHFCDQKSRHYSDVNGMAAPGPVFEAFNKRASSPRTPTHFIITQACFNQAGISRPINLTPLFTQLDSNHDS